MIFVIHDWGSALGFDWANRNRDRVAGIVYMEALVTPVTWADWPENARRAFQGFRSDGGEDMILQKNMFVERVLPGSVLRKLTDEEMAEYRRPFANPGEDRRPTLTWPRQIPIEGEPADVVQVVEDYSAWLAASDVPKLFINADPGSILVGRQREVCRAWPNQTEVTVQGPAFPAGGLTRRDRAGGGGLRAQGAGLNRIAAAGRLMAGGAAALRRERAPMKLLLAGLALIALGLGLVVFTDLIRRRCSSAAVCAFLGVIDLLAPPDRGRRFRRVDTSDVANLSATSRNHAIRLAAPHTGASTWITRPATRSLSFAP